MRTNDVKQMACQLCKRESMCEWYPGISAKTWLCQVCGQKYKLRHLYEMYLEKKEITLYDAMAKLSKNGYSKDDIKFILGMSKEKFSVEINRLKNLKQYRDLYKKFSEKISPGAPQEKEENEAKE